MQINSIADNNFEGKIIYDTKLSKPMKEFAEKILDYPFSGTTARDRIKKATYDVKIYGRTTKKTIHPKLHFSSSIKLIPDKKQFLGITSSTYVNGYGVSIHSTVGEGAYEINKFLTRFELYKNSYKNAYNTFGEKMKAYFVRMFNL